eukprot:CAMPEP_0204822398 /NCGR_PEP_ID=MMETSP1346-20131115/586_1 /ASSEMBLY_ACC=CAM_ASM_000771 /TAXON_ID=215587 /ORGANISM="Aplanochytrium stocchinoi, Strain GSBS06" /LENGTH=60 /DNA_ID=CAMNT_0051948587 /DNA_START=508 /DNA_END=690 /DNA_ORIENTATION=-
MMMYYNTVTRKYQKAEPDDFHDYLGQAMYKDNQLEAESDFDDEDELDDDNNSSESENDDS